MKDLRNVIGGNETVVWEGRPDKKCFVLESIFNPLLPFAILWLVIDLFAMFSEGSLFEEGGSIILIFFAFHLMPVWIYLGGLILTVIRFKHTQYLITDKGVYVSGGAFTYTFKMKPFAELSSITMHQGIIDRICKTGDVIMNSNVMPVGGQYNYGASNNYTNLSGMNINNIKDYEAVYKLVKELQTDVYSDTMYPNELRPGENKGYKTKINKDFDSLK